MFGNRWWKPVQLLEAKRNDAEWKREEQRKQLEKVRKMKQLKQLQDKIIGIEAESTVGSGTRKYWHRAGKL